MKMKKNAILVVEDEVPIRDVIKFALKELPYQIIEAENVNQAAEKMAHQIPQLILLDWMLPGKSGIDFAKQLKKEQLTKDIPIIMLTAKAEEENKLKGLEIADDYITKPFSPKELIARIKNVLRRGLVITPENKIEIDELVLNVDTREVLIKNQSLKLTPIEYQLLHFFLTHPDRIYSRAQLLDHVWGRNVYIDERTVDVHIRRLRKALSQHGYANYIQTVRSGGYKFSSTRNTI